MEFYDFNQRDKNISKEKILLSHPSLSKKQAEFLISCNEKGNNYTLSHFQKQTHSSYETSRYSLEQLVELGFYKKDKIGKKFVYTCLGKNPLVSKLKD